MNGFKRSGILAGLPLLAVFLSGCMATTSTMKHSAATPARPANNITTRVVMTDGRAPVSGQREIGKIYNQYNTAFGPVLESPTLLADLQKALEVELSNAGYSIVPNGEIVIHATLHWLSVDVRGQTSEAKVKIQYEISDRGEKVIDHFYEGSGDQYNLMGIDSGVAITKSAQQNITQMIEDLDKYIRS